MMKWLDKSLCSFNFFVLKINTWGYSTINFFAPMSRYASAGGGSLKASQEFKEMVKALHGAGIEVNQVLSGFRIGNTYCLLNIICLLLWCLQY